MWATKESEKQGISADGQCKRRILGERIIKAMRFPLMNQKEFIRVVLDHKFLTLDEFTDLIKHFNSPQSSPVGFPSTSNLIRCSRFSSVQFDWGNYKSSIVFFINSDILFHGLSLFGSKDNTYSVTLRLFLGFHRVSSIGGLFPSVCHAPGEYYGFDVLFKEPISLKKGVTIPSIAADISGPDSWFGTGGRPSLRCAGVTFTLEDYPVLDERDRTGIREGQFDEFILSLISK